MVGPVPPITGCRVKADAPWPPTEGFGHGKVILLGEHTVVAGHPALAVGLRAGVRARIRAGTGHISAPTWNLNATVNDGSTISTALCRLCEAMGVLDASVLDVDLQTDIPSRAGLGSSAAVAMGKYRALVSSAACFNSVTSNRKVCVSLSGDSTRKSFEGGAPAKDGVSTTA